MSIHQAGWRQAQLQMRLAGQRFVADVHGQITANFQSDHWHQQHHVGQLQAVSESVQPDAKHYLANRQAVPHVLHMTGLPPPQ